MTFYQKSEVVTFNKSQKSKQESLLFIYDFYKESAVIMKSQFFVFIVALTVRKTLYDFFSTQKRQIRHFYVDTIDIYKRGIISIPIAPLNMIELRTAVLTIECI